MTQHTVHWQLDIQELLTLADDTKKRLLTADESLKMTSVVKTLAQMTELLRQKDISIKRLRKLIFGASSEKTSSLLKAGKPTDPDKSDEPNISTPEHNSQETPQSAPDSAETLAQEENKQEENKQDTEDTNSRLPKKGHGRKKSDQYVGANRTHICHPDLKPGDVCPECGQGKLYSQAPAILVRIVGQPPLTANIYESDRLRCNLCGLIFTAPAPEAIGSTKYDASAPAMISVLKYGNGIPFNRLEKLQNYMGIPMPSSTQWDLVKAAADDITPVYKALIIHAAQGEIHHNDDTTAKVLDLMAENKAQAKKAAEEKAAETKAVETKAVETKEKHRTGIFTTGIVSICGSITIALFFTGRNHAGENLADVLRHRAADLESPIQMSDALSRNVPKMIETVMGNCNAHARRKYVEIFESFPKECQYVLETLAEVYKTDHECKAQNLSAEERVRVHQTQSAPRMEQLHS